MYLRETEAEVKHYTCTCIYMFVYVHVYVHERTEVYRRDLLLGENVLSKDSSVLS